MFGRNDETQFFHRLVRSSLMLGKGFGDHPAAMRMTPVDYAAQAIAHLSLRANGMGETFHLPTMAPLGFADFFAVYNQRSDRRLPLSSYSAWLGEVVAAHHAGVDLPALPLVYDAAKSDAIMPPPAADAQADAVAEFRHTQALLDHAGIRLPDADAAFIWTCLQGMAGPDDDTAARYQLELGIDA